MKQFNAGTLMTGLLMALPHLCFANVSKVCSNAEATIRYTSDLQTPGTLPAGVHLPAVPVVTLMVNGSPVLNSNASLTKLNVIDNPPVTGPVQQSVYSGVLSFQSADQTIKEFVICRETMILIP